MVILAWDKSASEGSFLAVLRDDGESYLALLDIKHRITGCALSVNCLFLCNRYNFPAPADSGKELCRIESAFLRSCNCGSHGRFLRVKRVQNDRRGLQLFMKNEAEKRREQHATPAPRKLTGYYTLLFSKSVQF
jgi:hypothetical protein